MPAHGTIIVIKRNGTDGSHFQVTTSSCTIGRDLDCDIRIQLPNVSNFHCKIYAEDDGQIIISNLSDVNPTVLNGEPLLGSCPLKHSDVFQLVDRSFRWESHPQSLDALAALITGKSIANGSASTLNRASLALVSSQKLIKISTDVAEASTPPGRYSMSHLDALASKRVSFGPQAQARSDSGGNAVSTPTAFPVRAVPFHSPTAIYCGSPMVSASTLHRPRIGDGHRSIGNELAIPEEEEPQSPTAPPSTPVKGGAKRSRNQELGEENLEKIHSPASPDSKKIAALRTIHAAKLRESAASVVASPTKKTKTPSGSAKKKTPAKRNLSSPAANGSATKRTPAKKQLARTMTTSVSKKKPTTPLSVKKTPKTPLSTKKTPTTPLSTKKTPTTPLSKKKTPTTPLSTKKTPTTPLSTKKTPTTPLSTKKTPTTPLSTKKTPTTPISAKKMPTTPLSAKKTPTGKRLPSPVVSSIIASKRRRALEVVLQSPVVKPKRVSGFYGVRKVAVNLSPVGKSVRASLGSNSSKKSSPKITPGRKSIVSVATKSPSSGGSTEKGSPVVHSVSPPSTARRLGLSGTPRSSARRFSTPASRRKSIVPSSSHSRRSSGVTPSLRTRAILASALKRAETSPPSRRQSAVTSEFPVVPSDRLLPHLSSDTSLVSPVLSGERGRSRPSLQSPKSTSVDSSPSSRMDVSSLSRRTARFSDVELASPVLSGKRSGRPSKQDSAASTPNRSVSSDLEVSNLSKYRTPDLGRDHFVSPLTGTKTKKPPPFALERMIQDSLVGNVSTPPLGRPSRSSVARPASSPRGPGYVDVSGLKRLMRGAQKSPNQGLDDVFGLKRLMRSPAKSPKADYSKVEGLKRLMKTPSPQVVAFVAAQLATSKGKAAAAVRLARSSKATTTPSSTRSTRSRPIGDVSIALSLTASHKKTPRSTKKSATIKKTLRGSDPESSEQQEIDVGRLHRRMIESLASPGKKQKLSVGESDGLPASSKRSSLRDSGASLKRSLSPIKSIATNPAPSKTARMKSLSPPKSTSKRSLSPPKSTSKRSLSPPKSTSKRSLSPLNSLGKRILSPPKSATKRSLSPPKSNTKRSLPPPKSAEKIMLSPRSTRNSVSTVKTPLVSPSKNARTSLSPPRSSKQSLSPPKSTTRSLSPIKDANRLPNKSSRVSRSPTKDDKRVLSPGRRVTVSPVTVASKILTPKWKVVTPTMRLSLTRVSPTRKSSVTRPSAKSASPSKVKTPSHGSRSLSPVKQPTALQKTSKDTISPVAISVSMPARQSLNGSIKQLSSPVATARLTVSPVKSTLTSRYSKSPAVVATPKASPALTGRITRRKGTSAAVIVDVIPRRTRKAETVKKMIDTPLISPATPSARGRPGRKARLVPTTPKTIDVTNDESNVPAPKGTRGRRKMAASPTEVPNKENAATKVDAKPKKGSKKVVLSKPVASPPTQSTSAVPQRLSSSPLKPVTGDNLPIPPRKRATRRAATVDDEGTVSSPKTPAPAKRGRQSKKVAPPAAAIISPVTASSPPAKKRVGRGATAVGAAAETASVGDENHTPPTASRKKVAGRSKKVVAKQIEVIDLEDNPPKQLARGRARRAQPASPVGSSPVAKQAKSLRSKKTAKSSPKKTVSPVKRATRSTRK